MVDWFQPTLAGYRVLSYAIILKFSHESFHFIQDLSDASVVVVWQINRKKELTRKGLL